MLVVPRVVSLLLLSLIVVIAIIITISIIIIIIIVSSSSSNSSNSDSNSNSSNDKCNIVCPPSLAVLVVPRVVGLEERGAVAALPVALCLLLQKLDFLNPEIYDEYKRPTTHRVLRCMWDLNKKMCMLKQTNDSRGPSCGVVGTSALCIRISLGWSETRLAQITRN